MPTIARRISVAANARSANVLAGDVFEVLPAAASVILAAVVAGGTPGDVVADMLIGGESVLSASNVSTRNGYPSLETDVVLTSGGVAGEKLNLQFTNTTAGALNVDYLIVITPGPS